MARPTAIAIIQRALLAVAVCSACTASGAESMVSELEEALMEVDPDVRDAFLDDEIRAWDGAWLGGYAKLHAAIRAGDVPPQRRRYAVWTCDPLSSSTVIADDSTRMCLGIGNRIMGLVAAFLYAVLTERAFVVEWPGRPEEHLGQLLASPYFDWMPHSFQRMDYAPEDILLLDTRLGRAEVRHKLSTFDWRSDHPQRVVRLTLLEGYYQELLSNPSLQSACSLGLGLEKPSQVIGRLGRILLRPRPAVSALLREARMDARHVLARSAAEQETDGRRHSRACATLGLQVRLGDTGGGAYGQVGMTIDQLERFRQAAESISGKLMGAQWNENDFEDKRHAGSQGAGAGRLAAVEERGEGQEMCEGVAWVLAADSLRVVEEVSHWVRRVIWYNSSSPSASGRGPAELHSAYGMGSVDSKTAEAERERDDLAKVMLKTVVDFWLLAQADHVLISVPSTFGFTARSLNLTGIYLCM